MGHALRMPADRRASGRLHDDNINPTGAERR
jgi:hypothetical protein